jgi:uncharacterized protein
MDKVTWFELPADNISRAGKFYSKVFGWKTSDMGGGSLMALTAPSDDEGNPTEPGSINGDISARAEGFDRPTLVITVEDMNAKIKLVEEAGGKVILPAKNIPEMGIIWALVADTEGNAMGVLQNV